MNAALKKIDLYLKAHIEESIAKEKNQNIEDSIFFSSYTVGIEVFTDATKKLKKMLKNGHLEAIGFLKDDVDHFMAQYHLDITLESEEYHYLFRALLKAQIKINEAIMENFSNLCKNAHCLDYLESRAEEIHHLLYFE